MYFVVFFLALAKAGNCKKAASAPQEDEDEEEKSNNFVIHREKSVLPDTLANCRKVCVLVLHPRTLCAKSTFRKFDGILLLPPLSGKSNPHTQTPQVRIYRFTRNDNRLFIFRETFESAFFFLIATDQLEFREF